MGLDTSIPLQARQFQLESPLDVQQRVYALKDLQAGSQMRDMQMAQARKAQQEEAMMADLYRQHGTNRDGFAQGLAQSGLGGRLPGFQKQWADADKEAAQAAKFKAETEKIGVEAMAKRLDHVQQVTGMLANKPDLTQEDVIRALASSPPEMRDQASLVVRLMGNLQGPALQQWAEKMAMNAKERFDAFSVSAAQQLTANTATRGQDLTAQVSREGHGVTMRGQNMADSRARETNATAREANAINREAQQSQIINDPIAGPLIVNKGSKTATPALMDGKPVPGETVVKAKRSAAQMETAIAEAEKLLPNATGSGVGTLADKSAGFFGGTLKGGEEAARLKTLSGWLVANVPRMEGPQSNIDVMNYKEMAGQIGDSTIPIAQRKAALDSLKTLQAKYSALNGGEQPKQTTPAKRPPLESFNR